MESFTSGTGYHINYDIVNSTNTMVILKSDITNNINSMVIPMSIETFKVKLISWKNVGVYFNEVFKEFSGEEKDFLKTGVTPEEWEAIMF